MNASSLTGLLVIAGITVWLGMFIPAWLRGEHQAESNRAVKGRIKNQAKAQLANQIRVKTKSYGQTKQRVKALSNVRTVLGYLTLISIPVGLVSLISVATVWPLTVAAFGTTAVSIVVNRIVAARIAANVPAKAAVRTSAGPGYYSALYQAASEYGAKVDATPVATDDRSWTPRAMPAPLHVGHIGELEQPVLAEVSEISRVAEVEVAQPEVAATHVSEQISGSNLDEILRRRRAI
jgi:hypothetical protein